MSTAEPTHSTPTYGDTVVPMYCAACNYPLWGLESRRCPECGRPFDPSDPKSYGSSSLGRTARALLSPPGWPLIGFCALLSVLNLYGGMTPRGNFATMILCLLGWFLAGMWYLLRLVACGLTKWRCRCKCPAGPRYRRWLAPAAVFSLTMVMLLVDAPAGLTFQLSKSAMERLARDAQAMSPGTNIPDQRIGLYSAHSITQTPGGISFMIYGCDGFLAECGLAYLPQGVPASMPVQGFYQPYRGAWFLWSSD